MTPRPRHTKKDANQQDIIDGLRDAGYVVKSIADICPWADIIVWGYDYFWHDYLWRVFEIKTEDGELTPTERDFQRAHPSAVKTVRSANDALAAFGRICTVV